MSMEGYAPQANGRTAQTVEFEWNGTRVRAWVPSLLGQLDFALSAATARTVRHAGEALKHADASLPTEWQPMERLLLRYEGMASSGIEGLSEPIESVLAAERTGAGGNAGRIVDNLTVIDAALRTAHHPLSVETLHQWHGHLMRNSPLHPHMMGRFRSNLGWIGGTDPVDAAYAPPPPAEIPRLIGDLIAFADHSPSGVDAVSRAAVVHAQFMAIHPYEDGNGQLGRALISRMQRRSGVTTRSTALISTEIAGDLDVYLSGLQLFGQGLREPWVRWFAETATRASAVTEHLVQQVARLMKRWNRRIAGLRADHTARALLAHLPGSPVLSAPHAAALLNVSEDMADTALAVLATRKILIPLTDASAPDADSTDQWFAATKLLKLQK